MKMLLGPFHHSSHGGAAATALRRPTAVGLKKGHRVTTGVSKPRHSHRPGRLTKHPEFVRDLIRAACGFAPDEWRAVEPAAHGI